MSEFIDANLVLYTHDVRDRRKHLVAVERVEPRAVHCPA